MKPNVGPAAMVRLGASLGLLAALTVPALAGDRAMIDILGYSADYRYFAFEEHGVQDGSGFPYANIYVLDLPADDWVAGSPYRVRLDEDGASEIAARETARQQAEPLLDKLGIGTNAEWIAMNGDGEAGDGKTLKFGSPGYFFNDPQGQYELTLDTFAADSAIDCSIVDEVKGFALTLNDNGTMREVHRDTALPASRGCAMEYRIHGVVAQPAVDAVHAGVAIISVFPFGFEGPDRRFIAVPITP